MKKKSFLLILFIILLLCGGGFAGLIVLTLMFSPDQSSDFSFSTKPIVIVKIEGGIFESETVLKELNKYGEDKDVKAIVLRIDSPGGAVGPSQEIFTQVKKVRTQGKKVIVSMGTVAASGGYYIASAADKIVASPGTITGSIGVIMQSFGLKEVAETLKVEPRVIKSGRMKDAGNPFRDVDPEEREYLQALSDDLYEQFLRDVSEQRKIPYEDIRPIAEGRIYSGLAAKKLKLIDATGNLFDAIDLARKEAGLAADAKVRWPKEPSPLEKFFEESASLGSLQNLFLKIGVKSVPLWHLDGI